MRHCLAIMTAVVGLAVVLASCGIIQSVKETFSRDPEVEAISDVLHVAVPLSYAATCAMNAHAGNTPAGVTVVTQASGTAGSGFYRIETGSANPLPIGSDTTMTIYVTALWSSPEQAIMSVFFTRVSGMSLTLLSSVGIVPVERDSSGFRVVYADQDVGAHSDTVMTLSLSSQELASILLRLNTEPPSDSNVAVDQNAWITIVDTNGTSDPSDDSYTVTGAGQHAVVNTSSTSMVQHVMLNALIDGCTRNPTSGRSILRDLDVSNGTSGKLPEMGTTVFTFRPACDGKVDVTVATGTYVGKTGSRMSLGL